MTNALKSLLFTTLVLFTLHLQAANTQTHKTVCLNMIVKDESRVITRCLSSTLPVIDYWVIVDTGSTDGTQQIIKDYMKEKGVPGELHERPWIDFEHNRNEAIELAKNKADYLFFIDADEYMSYDPDFELPALDKDYYYGTISYSGTKYDRIKMISTGLDCKYVGVLHEVLCPPPTATFGTIQKMLNVVTPEGARSKDPEKYLKDAKVLENALKKDPNSARNVYYLAQSYRDAGELDQALKYYEQRIAMGGWDQETFVAMLGAGTTKDSLNKPKEEVVAAYKRAFLYRPTRIEPLYYLANYLRRQNDFTTAYQIAKVAMTLPVSEDGLFVQHWLYDYGMPLEFSVLAYWTGNYEESQKASLDLLKKNDLPENIRELVEANLGFANAKLVEAVITDQTGADKKSNSNQKTTEDT